jgi:GrpB-like predicted nucleotidyltransferase (UPF0157 family)
MTRIVVVPHNPQWSAMYEAEAARLAQVLGPAAVAMHHIGSTAIPRIRAKPIIDILVEAIELDAIDSRNAALQSLGYEVMGECGIRGRRYFRKDTADGQRTHNVHVFAAGTDNVTRHLAFRDFMRAHPDVAQRYSDLKSRLASEHRNSLEQYMDGKDGFIKQMERLAVQWYRDEQ